MAEVDLIPEDYRQAAHLKRFSKKFLLVFAFIVLLVALGKGLLSFLVAMENKRTMTLETSEVLIVEHRNLLKKLDQHRADLQQRLAILDSLRGGPPAQRMFQIIDRAVNQSVWFTSLRFKRTKEDLQALTQSRDTGYFRVVQQTDNRQHGESQEQMRMEINGQALNHSALADLVKKLLDQQEVHDVHILNTSTLQYPSGQVTAYKLVVTIKDW
jgi:Tfp pilus assembly protein PilN